MALLSQILAASTVRGEKGPTATVDIGSVTTLNPNQTPTVANEGSTGSALFSFGLPRTASVSMHATPMLVGNPNSNPAVVNSGTGGDVVLQMTMPRAPVVSLGSVANATSGQTGNVTSTTSGAGDVAFNFVVPQGLIWRGTWNSATTYYPRDAVQYLGSAYICILESTNNAPPNDTYWSLFATSGAVGATGGGSDQIFWENGKTITTSYTVAGTVNMSSSGTITIQEGVTVTVADGGEWSIV
jgi:hypothetical protein